LSVIAGVISLSKDSEISKENVCLMLKAMAPLSSSEVEMCVVPKCSATFGRVAYGPDMNNFLNKDTPDNYPKVLWAGELYNDEALEYDSFVDFVIEEFRQQNTPDFAAGLNGSFVTAVADPVDGSVYLITDHTASYSLFTVIHNGKFYFASEVKGLLAIPNLPCQPDFSSVLSLAACGFFVDRKTLVENVVQMDYATIYKIHDGRIQTWPYWRYSVDPEKQTGTRKYIDEFSGLLRQAVERRTRTGRVAILLSGGVDSRGILCCMDEPKRLQAVTHTLKTKQTRHEMGDWAIAEKITEKLGMDFLTFHANSSDWINAIRESVYYSEGAAGFIFENIWSEIRKRAELEYLLTGDECMGWTNGSVSNNQVLATVGIHSLAGLAGLRNLLNRDKLGLFLEQMESVIESIKASCTAKTACDCVDELYFQQRLIHYVNAKRRVISKYMLSIRSPWLDPDILNFIRKVPASSRITKKLFRKTLVYLNPTLMRLPRARANEALNYHQYLINIENKYNGVSSIIFDDNPFLEEIFNFSSINDLIKEVCILSRPGDQVKHFDYRALIPQGFRLKLGTLQRYFFGYVPCLSNVQLLCRTMVVAESLRQLKERFSTKNSSNIC